MQVIDCKQGAFGTYKPTATAEATHVLLEKADFEQLLADNRNGRARALQWQNECKKAEAKTAEWQQRHTEYVGYVADRDNKLVRLKQLYDELDAECKELRKYNDGLQRVMRQRANAARNLRPASTNNGYMVLQVDQSEYTNKFRESNRTQTYKLPCWKTTLDTPYAATLPTEQVKSEIFRDLVKRGPLLRLGIKYINLKYWDDHNDEPPEENMVFRLSYRANFRTGRWEVTFWSSGAVTVPDSMLPYIKK